MALSRTLPNRYLSPAAALGWHVSSQLKRELASRLKLSLLTASPTKAGQRQGDRHAGTILQALGGQRLPKARPGHRWGASSGGTEGPREEPAADPEEDPVPETEEEVQEQPPEEDAGYFGPVFLVLSLACILAGSYLFLTEAVEKAEVAVGTGTGTALSLAWLGVGDLGETLYGVGEQANSLVQSQLNSLSPASLGVILGAGLVTSLSPCTLSVLPLTIGYIGGYEQNKTRVQLVRDSVAFALGLATTLAALGVVASLAGKAYGQIGSGLPIAVSCVAILMGLNLLDVISVPFPTLFGRLDAKDLAAGFPSSVQAYLAGLLFALAASPCSTPVLATLLSYVASTQDPVLGTGLLLTYTTGYVAPLLFAASFTGALKRILALRAYSSWINPASGCLLLGGGLYSLLSRLVPENVDHMDHMM